MVLHVGNDNWYKNVAGLIEAALYDRNDFLLVSPATMKGALGGEVCHGDGTTWLPVMGPPALLPVA